MSYASTGECKMILLVGRLTDWNTCSVGEIELAIAALLADWDRQFKGLTLQRRRNEYIIESVWLISDTTMFSDGDEEYAYSETK
jgi:hypothetical protein